jgi:hypothetical protein
VVHELQRLDGSDSHQRGQPILFGRSVSNGTVVTVILGAGFLAGLLLQGFGFPEHNNVFHLPIVLHYAQSAEGPHDLFHQGLSNYVSAVWVLLSRVATEQNVEFLFFLIYALNKAALIALLYFCAREIAPPSRDVSIGLALACSVITIALWPVWALSPFWSDIFHRSLSQTEIAMTLLVGSFWLMLRERWFSAALCIGIAFNVNAFVAIWGGVMLAGSWLWANRAESRSLLLRRAAVIAACGVVPAIPTAVWILHTVSSGSPANAFDYRSYLEDIGLVEHNLPDENLLGVFSAGALACVVYAYLQEGRYFRSPRLRQLVAAYYAILLGVLVFGCVLPFLFNSRLLYTLYPLRMDSVLILPLYVSLAAVALATAERAAGRSFWIHLLVLFGLANGNLPLAVFTVGIATVDLTSPAGHKIRYASSAVLLAAAALVVLTGETPVYDTWIGQRTSLMIFFVQVVVACLAWRDADLRDGRFFLGVALMVTALLPDWLGGDVRYVVAIIYVAAAFYGRFFWRLQLAVPVLLCAFFALLQQSGAFSIGRMQGIAVPLLGISASVATVAAHKRERLQEKLKPWVLSGVLVLAVIGGLGRLWSNGTINYLNPEERAQIDAEVWLRGHSRPDEMVLPLGINGFTALSRRPIWIDWQSAQAAMWQPSYYAVWQARYDETKALGTIDEALAYARRHGIPFIALARSYAIQGDPGPNTIYENSHYVLMAP